MILGLKKGKMLPIQDAIYKLYGFPPISRTHYLSRYKMKCSFSLFQLCFYYKHQGSGQQYLAALFCRLQLEHFSCCLMREHLALSHRLQGLLILHSTGSVLPIKGRLHIKDTTAVLKGQSMNCTTQSHPFSLPVCRLWLSLRATGHLPDIYTVTFGSTLSLLPSNFLQ